MATIKEELRRVNVKINKVLGSKSWVGDLNLTPLDGRAIVAFNYLLDYIEMLQKQVRGLEEEIGKIR